MRRFAAFAALMLLGLAVSGGLLSLVFVSTAEREALLVSAAVAFVVQLFAFTIAAMAPAKKAFSGFVIGTMLRMVTLVVFGLVVVRMAELPPAAALIGLATFLFLSTILETRLLKT